MVRVYLWKYGGEEAYVAGLRAHQMLERDRRLPDCGNKASRNRTNGSVEKHLSGNPNYQALALITSTIFPIFNQSSKV
jgi:hypothetical protein